MNKKSVLLILVCLLLTIGCGKKTTKWKESTFFDKLPAPAEKIDRISNDSTDDTKKNYSVFVNNFSYEEFYQYINQLEKEGFRYEFMNEYVPKDINKLADKTETSWRANNGNIYIIANWRSNDNIYYSGYNLQLLFYNYDYTAM